MKKGRKLAESYGYKVMYFVGGNIRYAGGEFRGVVDTANKTVMVRADHPDYTAEQIMRHEMGHAAFENGDLSLNEAKEMLLGDFTEDELNELIEIYSSAYGGILSTDEAFEEICCDALGRMNIFEGTDLNSESYGKAQDTVRKYAAERTSSKGRAPPKKGGVKYSKEASGSIKQQLRKAENELNKMESVAIVNTPDLSKMNIKQQRQWAESFLKNTGYAISRKGFGKIEFSPKHINEGLNYLNSPAEVAAFAALPRVIKRGVEIDSHKQHKGRPRSSITIAAPVHINGVRGNMAVVVTITTKNHYHAHRILLPDGSEFTFNTKKVDSTPAEAAPNAESSPIKSTYENSIRNTVKNVNKKFSREPVSDAAYMEAVERRDTESAQRMVDEAAKKAGYTVKMYHGSKRGGGFTVFRDWSYFTKSKKYAQRYTERGNDKSLYSAYVKIENAFDTRKAADRYLFDEIRQEYGMGEIQDTGLPDWTDGYDIADYIDENGLNYDAIILDEGGDLVDGKPISRGLSYVIRNSNNIKSAEPITYDNNGNVIPLSERFKDSNPDIRYSREPERLNELRRQNEELKQREYALTLKSRSKRYKACSDLVRPTGFEPTTFRVGV